MINLLLNTSSNIEKDKDLQNENNDTHDKEESSEFLKAFLTGFDPNFNIKYLKKLLKAKFKGVIRIDIPKNFTSGYVFLYFKEKKYLEICLQKELFILKGREISIKKALYGKELDLYKHNFKQRRLFIGRIPYSFESKDLYRIFSKYGSIEQAYIVKHPSKGYSKGFGYLVTGSIELANELHEI